MFYDKENYQENTDFQNINFDEFQPQIFLKNPEIIEDLEIQITGEGDYYRLEGNDINLFFEPDDLDIDLVNFSKKSIYKCK